MPDDLTTLDLDAIRARLAADPDAYVLGEKGWRHEALEMLDIARALLAEVEQLRAGRAIDALRLAWGTPTEQAHGWLRDVATAAGMVGFSPTPHIGPCGCAERRNPWDRCDDCVDRGWSPSDPPALVAKVERLRAGLEAVASLIRASDGVAGLHLNGDVATWESLRRGGHHEGWLAAFDAATDGADDV